VDKASGMGGARHGPDFQNIHRNKRGLTLNLKEQQGIDVFKKMVAQADVVVENYRPDVKTRLGIDYPTLKQINSRLVYASISGFGQDGPYEKRPGFDQIAQGMGGLMSITGLPGQGPVRVGIPIADLSSGLYAALGIMVALLEREVSGEGQWERCTGSGWQQPSHQHSDRGIPNHGWAHKHCRERRSDVGTAVPDTRRKRHAR